MPCFAYHFTQMDNAVTILRDGEIRSRAEMQRLSTSYHDSASPKVIAKTSAAKLEYVRLYFRPRTPTQWHCEGIRPPAGITTHNAHCPVPVFFLYDLVDLLNEPSTMFSDGNMGSGSTRFSNTAELFDSIPFEHVYHDRALGDHRCAEVLVPKALSTQKLLFVVCRSHAERRTLLHKLPPELRLKYDPLVKIGGANFFFRHWTFVEGVDGAPGKVTIRLNPLWHSPRLDFSYDSEGRIWRWSGTPSAREPVVIGTKTAGNSGVVTVKLEGHEAFVDTVVLDDEPF